MNSPRERRERKLGGARQNRKLIHQEILLVTRRYLTVRYLMVTKWYLTVRYLMVTKRNFLVKEFYPPREDLLVSPWEFSWSPRDISPWDFSWSPREISPWKNFTPLLLVTKRNFLVKEFYHPPPPPRSMNVMQWPISFFASGHLNPITHFWPWDKYFWWMKIFTYPQPKTSRGLLVNKFFYLEVPHGYKIFDPHLVQV